MQLISKDIFVRSDGLTQLVMCNSQYTGLDDRHKKCFKVIETRDDTYDSSQIAFSQDNGVTWSQWRDDEVLEQTPQGVRRTYWRAFYVNPDNGLYVEFANEGLLPSDNPMDGLKAWVLRHRISRDGGKTFYHDSQVVQRGGQYSEMHPFEGVWKGRNSMMLGDLTCRPICHDGKLLQPVQTTPVGPDGEYYNPGGGLSYHESVVIIGTWTNDGLLSWDISERVQADPKLSTRGAVEPTIIELDDDKILMVVRGSNDVKPELPGYKWYCISEDGGYTWSELKPWTYEDGANFFSPSSCSQLLKHSNGNVYWLGNITPVNPNGNWPRYPFVIGQVDSQTGLLIRDSIMTIDDRQPDEAEEMTLSNFFAHEDRQTQEIILHMSRWKAKGNLSGDAYVYRILP